MAHARFDGKRSLAFADRMLGILNDGALSVMISIGHRTGLFDTMRELPPATSAEIAEAAGLNERYVREWLGAVVTGRIVECSDDGTRFSLPPEHAAWLTRQATPNNVAVYAQYIPQLGNVEDEIIECFKKGGGVPYSAYKHFHRIMAEDSGQTVVAALTDQILPLVPGLTDSLEAGIDVLDVGCGSGRALNLMAETYPSSRFVGCDLSEEAIAAGTRLAQERGLANVAFEVRDLGVAEIQGQYDLITAFDAVHDQACPDKVLAGVARALKPNGVFLMQDIAGSSHLPNNLDHPIAPLLYTISCLHCMTVSLAQNGAGLGAMWGEEKAREMLLEAGFSGIEVRRLRHDFQNNYFIVTSH